MGGRRLRNLQERRAAIKVVHLDDSREAPPGREPEGERSQEELPFVRALGHELRSPLNTIVGFSDMLLQGLSGDLNEEQIDFLTRVRGAAQRLGALHGDAIEILKVQAGLVDTEVSRFSLRELVESAARPSEEIREAKGLKLDDRVPAELIVETDRPHLRRCVAAYLDNAARYAKTGSIVVTATGDDASVRLTVRDSGVGIDARGLERVFEPFPRLRPRNDGEPATTELSLYLVRNIAEHVLGGDVSVNSAPDDGSEFSIEFENPLRVS